MRNPDWDLVAFTTQWVADTKELLEIGRFLSEKGGQLAHTDDPYHPYAVDHANEHLAHAAKRLREIADTLTRLRQYTNYPPLPGDLFPPPEMDDDLRATVKAALEGDSNDAEHDALFLVAEAYGIEPHYDDDDDDEDES